jgi:hypothetical protein
MKENDMYANAAPISIPELRLRNFKISNEVQPVRNKAPNMHRVLKLMLPDMA